MDVNALYIALIIVLALVYVLFYLIARKIKDRSKYLTNLPGPKPIFPFGNTLDFIPGSTVFLSNLQAYLKKHGDTILFHDGCFTWLVVTVDYEFLELIFTSSIFIEKSRQYEYLNGWLGQGLLTSTGSKWKSHRKAITPAFHFSILQNFVAIFDKVGNNLVKQLKKKCEKEDSIEISKLISLYALDVICEAAMGVKINALENDNTKYIKSIKTMCTIIVERSFSFLNPIVYPLTWNYYRENRALKVIHQHVDDVITKRIEDHKQNNVKETDDPNNEYGEKKRLALLDLLLEANINGLPLTRQELRDEVNTFMFEGHDTTSSAISFCLLMLATHPEVQQKVLKEQQDILGLDLKKATPTYKELNEMNYLDSVLKETLRLFPSVPLFGRTLAKDLEFKGTLYPKGLTVIMLPYAFHRNPTYFPDPEKFLPERFETFRGKFPFTYTPFSAGSRNCIGQKFAMLEMLSTVSKIVRNFELAAPNIDHKIQIAAETILISKNGIKISIRNRV